MSKVLHCTIEKLLAGVGPSESLGTAVLVVKRRRPSTGPGRVTFDSCLSGADLAALAGSIGRGGVRVTVELEPAERAPAAVGAPLPHPEPPDPFEDQRVALTPDADAEVTAWRKAYRHMPPGAASFRRVSGCAPVEPVPVDPDLVHLPTRLATVLRAAGPPLDAIARHVLLAMFVTPTMHGVYDPAPRGAGAALAELTGHSARSCWEALRTLEELGYVHVQRRGRGPHRYWLGPSVLQASGSTEEVPP